MTIPLDFRFIFLAYKLQLNVNLEMTPLCQVRKCWGEILGFCQVHGQDHLQEMMTEVLETSQRCLCVGFLGRLEATDIKLSKIMKRSI